MHQANLELGRYLVQGRSPLFLWACSWAGNLQCRGEVSSLVGVHGLRQVLVLERSAGGGGGEIEPVAMVS